MNIYKRKRSPYWWADVTIDGERHRFSTKRRDKGEAHQLVASFVREKLDVTQLGKLPEITCAKRSIVT